MTKPRWVVYAEVKKAVSIEQVLIYYGLLEGFTRRGDVLEGPCPIHRYSFAPVRARAQGGSALFASPRLDASRPR